MYDNTNKGIISKNDRKEKDTHPDIKGTINVDGKEYWLNGWEKQRNDGTGSFYSLSVTPKDDVKHTGTAGFSAPAVPDETDNDLEDEIPF